MRYVILYRFNSIAIFTIGVYEKIFHAGRLHFPSIARSHV